ncbi:MAG: MBL fold metallo-hydrolase [Chloroflexi bacterium]|nr:MBL fold metallo-hydrolase [Chloroflexota bacterium]
MTDEPILVRRIVVTSFVENAYLVADPQTRECMVIDPGGEVERIMLYVARDDLKVKLIVNTHGHMDHTGAVAAIQGATGAPYALHPLDVETMRRSAARGQLTIPGFQSPPEPEVELRDGEKVEVNGLSFQVLETPGHTPGSVCLYGHGVVFTGDTLFQDSVGRFDLPGGDGAMLLESIAKKLLTLPDETVVLPGHGPQSTIRREKEHNPFLQPDGRRFFA